MSSSAPSRRPRRRRSRSAAARWPAAARCRRRRRRRHQVVAAFYPLQYVAEQVAGDHVRGHQPDPARRRAARPRARHPADRRGRARPTWSSTSTASSRRSTTRSTQNADRRGRRRGRRGRPASLRRDGTTRTTRRLDPHFWQDPLLLADLGDAVADQLAEVDPDARGDVRRQRRRRCAHDLERARPRSTPTGWPTARATRSWSATTRSATSRRYGLHLEPIAGLSPDAEPTPADLARLAGPDPRPTGITTVFSERWPARKVAETPGRRPRRRRPRCSTRSRASATRPPTRTTCP